MTGAPVSDAAAPAGRGKAATVTEALYEQLARWRGIRYRIGDLSRKGIDCSGLAYVVYRDLFGARLPRTTAAQKDLGRAVERDALAPGDLVFFKTGTVQRHVGIYVEDGKFLHASRSGVRLSSLASKYWRDRYWKARRMTVVRAAL